MNPNVLQGKWKELKSEIRKTWSNITDDELEKTRGDVGAIGGLIQKRYGHSEQNYAEKLHGILSRFESKKEQTQDGMKRKWGNEKH